MKNDFADLVTFILLESIQFGLLVLAIIVFISGFF
jgi:hypothetical protein